MGWIRVKVEQTWAHHDTCDDENVCFTYEYQITPKTRDVLLGLTEEPSLTESVHVESKYSYRSDAWNFIGTELSEKVDWVGENNHQGHH